MNEESERRGKGCLTAEAANTVRGGGGARLSPYVGMHTICVHMQHVSAYITWLVPNAGCCYYYCADEGETQPLMTEG